MKISLIVGARPNFVKAAAIQEACKAFPQVELNIIHTGQHGGKLSDPLVKDLELNIRTQLSIPKGSTVDRLSITMQGLALQFEQDRPDWVMVVGDTDATLAGALTAAKMNIPLAHVEAGLRCGDSRMQEEINRRIVDHISTVCYTTTDQAAANLIREGHPGDKVILVGNVMIDTLFRSSHRAYEQMDIKHPLYYRNFNPDPYAVLTLHRAENVDDPVVLSRIYKAIEEITKKIQIYYPVHPRTAMRSYIPVNKNLVLMPPQSYLNFIVMLKGAKFVMTDSGGIQEETTALGVPCFTLRDSTERPETVREGTNRIVGTEPATLLAAIEDFRTYPGNYRTKVRPWGWDGLAAERIMTDLVRRG